MIKIGIIGMSDGNAPPYSWSSIINGVFDSDEITRMGYPAVAAYLRANKDTLGIPGARVTHVWCQERDIAESIARSSGITDVVDHLEEMAGVVDAVILGRDDPEQHVAMSAPFIKEGIPVFIDKPLAYSSEDLEWFAGQQAQGKFIMSCSSMRYANECRIAKQELDGLGAIELVTAVGKKDWKKYGIHLLEAVFAVLDDPQAGTVQYNGTLGREMVLVELTDGRSVSLHLFNDISGTFQLSFFGRQGWKLVDIRNSYSMFRDTIIEFVRSVEEGRPRLDFNKTKQLIRILIAANESRLQGGTQIAV